MKNCNFLLITLFLSAFSCKKKDNHYIAQPAMPVGAVWTTVDESNGLSGNQITDMEMDASGSVWVSAKKSWTSLIDTVWYFYSCSSISKVNANGSIQQKLDSLTSPVYKSSIGSFGFNSNGNPIFVANFPNGVAWQGYKIVEKSLNYNVYNDPYVGSNSPANFYFNSEGLWYCGQGSLVNFNNGVLSAYNSTNSTITPGSDFVDIEPVGNFGDFYFTSTNYLYKRGNSQITPLFAIQGTRYMDTDSLGNLWLVGNPNNSNATFELIKYDGVDTTVIETPISYSSSYISDLAIDSHDNIWIATTSSSINSNKGLYKWTGQTWINYTPDNSPLHSWKLTKLLVDKAGNLWIGSFDNGLIQLNEFGTRN